MFMFAWIVVLQVAWMVVSAPAWGLAAAFFPVVFLVVVVVPFFGVNLPLRFADALIRRWRLQFKTDAMEVVKRDGLQIGTLLRRFRVDPDVVRAALEQNG